MLDIVSPVSGFLKEFPMNGGGRFLSRVHFAGRYLQRIFADGVAELANHYDLRLAEQGNNGHRLGMIDADSFSDLAILQFDLVQRCRKAVRDEGREGSKFLFHGLTVKGLAPYYKSPIAVSSLRIINQQGVQPCMGRE